MHDSPEEKVQRERISLDLQELQNSQLEPGSKPVVTRESLVELGKQLWPLTYQGGSSDSIAFDRFCEALELGRGSVFHPVLADAMQRLPMEQLTSLWAARWADQVFPSLVINHKYAASLMSTSIPSEYAEDIVPPFKAFLIEVPKGLVHVRDEKGVPWDVRYALVQYVENRPGESVWNYVILTEGTVTLWRHGVPTKLLTEEKPEIATSWESYSFALKIESHDERVNMLIGRLILGCCLALSRKDSAKPVGKSHRYSPGIVRSSSEPLVRTFQVGKPVIIDCRDTVRDYLEGKRPSAPSVQKLVRGHWQRQPYGANSSLRKWIQKEPYWRGPEGSPILQRPMVLKGD